MTMSCMELCTSLKSRLVIKCKYNGCWFFFSMRVCHERLLTAGNSAAYISFGGLLMGLEGGYRKLSNLKQENVYLLLRR